MATRHQEMLKQHENARAVEKIKAKSAKDVAHIKGTYDTLNTMMGGGLRVMANSKPPKLLSKYVNDLPWYTKIAKWEDYTNIPLFWDPAQWVRYIHGSDATVSLPLLSCFNYVKTYGNTKGQGNISDSELNYSIISFVTKLRSKTSVSTSLDDSVFGLYLIAATEAYDLAFEIERDLRAAKTISGANPYLGRLVMSAAGIEYIQEDLENLYSLYGEFRIEMERLIMNVPLPKSFDLLHRRRLMRSFLLRDNNVSRSQLYMAYSKYIGMYNASESSVNFVSLGKDIGTRINQLVLAVQNIIEDSTMQDVMRAIRSGIPSSEYFTWELPHITDGTFVVVPAFEAELLEQLHNCVSAPYYNEVETSSMNIRTSPSGWLYQGVAIETPAQELDPLNYGIRFEVNGPVYGHFPRQNNSASVQDHLLLNFFDDSYSPGRIMEGTRLISTFRAFTLDGPYYVKTELCGFEVVDTIRIYYVDKDSESRDANRLYGDVYSHSIPVHTYLPGSFNEDGTGTYSTHEGGILHYISCFNWFPVVTLIDESEGSNLFVKFGELCSFAKLPLVNLEQLNRIACISAMKLVDPEYVR